MEILKDKCYYEDLYDRLTVEACLRTETIALSRAEKEGGKEFAMGITDFMHYFEKGERYANREQTINDWMSRDEKKQKRWDETPTPEARCKLCKKKLELDMKMFDSAEKKEELLRFSFGCKDCLYIIHLYEDGSFKEKHLWQCPKCKRELKRTSKREGNVIYSNESCICGYENQDKLDLDEKIVDEKEPLYTEQELPKLKERFCLNPEDGQEYMASKVRLEQMSELMKEIKEREES